MSIRWIPAELHTHTFHSDGSQSLLELAQSAKEAGIEIIALTDHNTQSGLINREQVEASTGIRIIPGMEWTTFYGHMVTLGLEQNVDWRQIGQGDIEKGIRQVHEAGGIAGIAHPFRIGSPVCTGCYWEYPIEDWSQLDYIEVWSTLMPFMKQDSQRAFALWTSLLNEGYHLAVTSGRDWHRTLPDDAPAAITYIGVEYSEEQEITYKQADQSMEQDKAGTTYLHNRYYIEAIRQGRLSITMGPMLELYAIPGGAIFSSERSAVQNIIHAEPIDSEANSSEDHQQYSTLAQNAEKAHIYQIGDTIPLNHPRMTLQLRIDRHTRSDQYELAKQQLRLVIMSDQGILAETKLDSEQALQEWVVQVDTPARWLRAELYGYFAEVCGMLAFTNAIYIEQR